MICPGIWYGSIRVRIRSGFGLGSGSGFRSGWSRWVWCLAVLNCRSSSIYPSSLLWDYFLLVLCLSRIRSNWLHCAVCCRLLVVNETRGFCHRCCHGWELALRLTKAVCWWILVREISRGIRTCHWGRLRWRSQTCHWSCGQSYRRRWLTTVQCPRSKHCRYVERQQFCFTYYRQARNSAVSAEQQALSVRWMTTVLLYILQTG